jgi:hypothetical protein
MKWITREKVKVDRVACPWLIKKFIDPQAEFIFVPAEQVDARARELGATPFDIKGCELGHHGEDVSFNSILKKYDLTDPALMLLGEIVRAATRARRSRILLAKTCVGWRTASAHWV